MGRYLEIAKQVIPQSPAPSPSNCSQGAPWPVRCTLCGEMLSGLREGVEHIRAIHAGDTNSSRKNTPETLVMNFDQTQKE
jgi:hypothetical protein